MIPYVYSSKLSEASHAAIDEKKKNNHDNRVRRDALLIVVQSFDSPLQTKMCMFSEKIQNTYCAYKI